MPNQDRIEIKFTPGIPKAMIEVIKTTLKLEPVTTNKMSIVTGLLDKLYSQEVHYRGVVKEQNILVEFQQVPYEAGHD